MTTAQLYQALYQTVTAALPTIRFQQPYLPKPNVSTWGVITDDGQSVISPDDPYRQRVYFRVWLYMVTNDETALHTLADAVKVAVDGILISGVGTGQVRFSWLMTSSILWSEEYACRFVNLQFRTITSSI